MIPSGSYTRALNSDSDDRHTHSNKILPGKKLHYFPISVVFIGPTGTELWLCFVLQTRFFGFFLEAMWRPSAPTIPVVMANGHHLISVPLFTAFLHCGRGAPKSQESPHPRVTVGGRGM